MFLNNGVAVAGHMDAINGHIVQPWFGAANLNVLAFALIPLEGNARKTPDRIGDVGIGQARDHVGRQNLDDVVGGALNSERLDFSAPAFAGHGHDFIVGADLQNRIHTGCGIRGDGDLCRIESEPLMRDGNRIPARVEVLDRELTIRV